ncbi:MAG: DNA-formamidopyrimidine glycosylase [Candidatus Woykebacteria bacterium RIFCSPLOWO2_01_FULL_41_12]|uniref:Formamidopyrimidine-DNA glycosylase n=1 Tax=Candidatus Woykebacteria bacterium RIFCSPLOWO2_01_FULL_41_12 TaxID=1802604 RepID=A0A1G1WY70_9BACT|nr:MAG: DNA-formamidopyrimidine glycosylase [Candidatus Woykebacteria bacterium RIFCSPLOWO2_01_FULL_41_12]
MPELPEVETIRRDLSKELKGRKILRLKFYDWAKMLKPDPDSVAKAIEGKKIKGFDRRAKLLLMHLDDHGTTIAIHLKLSGQLFVRKSSDSPDRFTHIVVELDKGEELRFNDLRKFGFMKVVKDKAELDSLLSEFGPEPFTREFTFEKFKEIVTKSSRAVKTVIMDQTKIAGVGNIYADEALWRAKIHPETPANGLSDKNLKELFDAILFVLKQGIEDRGTSVDQYLDTHAHKGGHAKNLKVFRLNGEPCPRCGTIIKKIRVGGRGTHFCPSCQIKLH